MQLSDEGARNDEPEAGRPRRTDRERDGPNISLGNLRRVIDAALANLNDLLGDHLCQGVVAVN